jgi:hypothetical protein
MSIRLDPKHGVNPSVDVCFFCQQDRGVALLGVLTASQKRAFEEAGVTSYDDSAAPHRACYSREPCDECKGHMADGVILISVDEEKSGDDPENPYRTGGWVVVREEAITELINPPELLAHILRARIAFVPDDAWDMLGLPRGEAVKAHLADA